MNNEVNRTKAASLNASTMVVTQMISLVLKFAVQTAFIHQLSQNYLGLNGLFSNVISFLSFADLGIGTAITVALYKPIADGDVGQLRALIQLYRKAYRVIIIVMCIVGIVVSPFIHFFIKGSVFSNFEIITWFLIYFISTIATYFSAYKRSFLMATQLGYLNTINDFVFKSIQQGLQLIAIAYFHSFVSFLLMQALAAVAGNWQLSHLANRRFPKIFTNQSGEQLVKVSSDVLKYVKKNIVGAISSKIGSIVVFGTDNLILSAFVGLTAVAKYSNYTLIIQSVNSLFAQVISSFVSSIGNLHATVSPKRQEEVLLRLLYLNTLINLFVSVGLSFALNIFIQIWAGKSYVLSSVTVVAIVINYSATQSRCVIQNFISGMGLYWSLRWKSLIEAVVNLIISLFFVLGLHLGILGVVLGTLGSTITVNLLWEPYIVYHDGLKLKMHKYLLKYALYELFIIVVIVLMMYVSQFVAGIGIFNLVFYTIFAEAFAFILFVLLTFRLPEFTYLVQLVGSLKAKIFKK
ncbi:lipopolysaccharide biosynthesis protein [Lactiplantibacillus plantarum]|uniref:lipopolysaccharide biosynthesis protein n=1 Tax=Lactiplantibacillus plantarum TaxID=1590 RepID=UPI00155A657A|nr:lipopolysaccharide biosynthesis protein [Lactiplantibacillus plantarum]